MELRPQRFLRTPCPLILFLRHPPLSPHDATHNILSNPHTFVGVFSAASVFAGRQDHSVALKTASSGNVYVNSSLLNSYCKTDFVFDACKLFDRMPHRGWGSGSVSYEKMVGTMVEQQDYASIIQLMVGTMVELQGLCFNLILMSDDAP